MRSLALGTTGFNTQTSSGLGFSSSLGSASHCVGAGVSLRLHTGSKHQQHCQPLTLRTKGDTSASSQQPQQKSPYRLWLGHMPVSEPITEVRGNATCWLARAWDTAPPARACRWKGQSALPRSNESGKEVGPPEGGWDVYSTRKVNRLGNKKRCRPKEINGQRTKTTNTFQAL